MDITLPEATKSIVLTTGANASTNVQVQLSANGTELGLNTKSSGIRRLNGAEPYDCCCIFVFMPQR